MRGETVAIFGGSFNPPHVSHVLACALVRTSHDVDRVIVIPTFQHPFSKQLAPYEDRLAMCELALGWLPGVEVSRVEADLGGESRTLRTLQHLQSLHPTWKLRLVVGGDILLEAHKWHGWEEIKALAPPIVLGRAGVFAEGAPRALLPEISSSQIRDWIKNGEAGELEQLLPTRVREFIREHHLYV